MPAGDPCAARGRRNGPTFFFLTEGQAATSHPSVYAYSNVLNTREEEEKDLDQEQDQDVLTSSLRRRFKLKQTWMWMITVCHRHQYNHQSTCQRQLHHLLHPLYLKVQGSCQRHLCMVILMLPCPRQRERDRDRWNGHVLRTVYLYRRHP